MEEQHKRTGLLKQMNKKLGIDPDSCPGQEPWPCGDPPSTLKTLLLSDDWYHVFLTFLQDTELRNDQEHSEQSKELLRAARIVFSDGASREKGRGGFKDILAKFCEQSKEGHDIILDSFHRYLNEEAKVTTI